MTTVEPVKPVERVAAVVCRTTAVVELCHLAFDTPNHTLSRSNT